MKAVILAGGLGTRISEETQVRPKPMVEIGGRPFRMHLHPSVPDDHPQVAIGREHASAWLADDLANVGLRSTVNVHERYL